MKYTEGKVTINIPDRTILNKKNETFLNEHKSFDRDIHILLLKSLGWKNKSYLDLFSASGIRALRISKETNCFNKIICNDLNEKAVKNIEKNFKNNKEKVEIHNLDARVLLCNQDFGGLDHIDIDPYGSPIYFIVDAMKKLSRGGLLSVCATDTGALSGTFPSTCKRRYHSKSFLSEFYYESGIRILIKEIINLASTYDVALVPIFAHATRHYFRVYFKKIKGAKIADKLINQINYVSYCKKCLHREIGQKEICDCGEKFIQIGPLFVGNIYDKKLVKKMKKSKIHEEFFNKILEEIKENVPWFYTTDRIAKTYKLMEPKLKDLKYSRTHISPKGFKTKKTIKEIIKKFK